MTTCRIPLGKSGEHEAIVDAEDYAYLTQWKWNAKVSAWAFGSKVCARRSGPRDPVTGNPTTILMHVEILTVRMGKPCPGGSYTVDHGDVNSLNNTRGNLSWATKSEQSANQNRKFRTAAAKNRAIAEATGHEEIPFWKSP